MFDRARDNCSATVTRASALTGNEDHEARRLLELTEPRHDRSPVYALGFAGVILQP
jgi:hypothetical protein